MLLLYTMDLGMDVRVGTIKKAEHWRIDAFELWCWRRLASPLDCKDIQPVHPKGAQSCFVVHWKDWCWSWNSNTLATWCEDLTHLKRPWCWERLRAGEGDDRGWDGWMASPTQWTWVWVDSGSRWWTGRPGLLWSMGSQRVGHDWVTELNWMDYNTVLTHLLYGLGSQKICVACITAIFALL